MTEKRVKQTVRRRAGGKCERCGMTDEECKRLTGRRCHVHRRGEKYIEELCELLCMGCHRDAHGAKDNAAVYAKIANPGVTKQAAFRLNTDTLRRLDTISLWLQREGLPHGRTNALRFAANRVAKNLKKKA